METLFIGKNLIFLPEVHSTNSYATDLLKNVNLPEGTVIHAAHQSQGKGQRGAVWEAEAGLNLTASVVLKPGFLNLNKQFFLYQIAALACYDAMSEILQSSQFDIKIKWPNDILVNKKKIAGILIESTIHHNQVNWTVVGIGINVNQQAFATGQQVTSLKLLTNKTYAVEELLKILCKHLEKHYLSLLNSKFHSITELYLGRLFALNTFMDFEINGEIQTYCVKGVSNTGLLILKDRQGVQKEVDVKEVKWLY